MAEINGATIIARALKEQGVENMYGVDQRPADDSPVFVDDNCFGLRRADIDACRISHE